MNVTTQLSFSEVEKTSEYSRLGKCLMILETFSALYDFSNEYPLKSERYPEKKNTCKHLPVFVVHLKQVFFVIVAATGDRYALLWKLSLDLVYLELLKSPNVQIFHWERSGATEGQLQIPVSLCPKFLSSASQSS